MSVVVRLAGAADAAFLTEMLVEAAFWRPDGPRGSVDDVARQPALAHYVAGWPQPGDRGVVAEYEHRPVGAAWLRFFTAEDPGYGFVEAAIPEVSTAVVQDWRGQGVGAHLLAALIDAAREAGLVAISLSVEPGNYARRLYDRFGFREIGQVDGSLTMLLRL
jgi:GNAT superfamily N-acetyltransferase